MRKTTPILFFLSWILVIGAALLYIWSDNTPNGILGMKLETISIVMVTIGFIILLYDTIKNWK